MDTVFEFFQKLFQAESWPPRWQCGEWTNFHGWLYIGANLSIWAAYFAIPIIMFYFMMKRKQDLPFVKIFWLFILFILTCGSTHFMDATLFYYPAYRLSAMVLVVCAISSWAAIYGLIRVMPEALHLKSPVQLEKIIDERTQNLQRVKRNLEYQNEQLSNFADITSHNLRSPVSNLVALVNLYEKETDTTKRDGFMKNFKQESNGLMQTLNDLNEVVKVKKHKDIKRDHLLFENCLERILGHISTEVKESGAQIDYDFSKRQYIDYPKAYLESIFLNLLTNAIKYRSSERPLKVELKTFEKDGDVFLTCTDNGLGLDMNKHGNKVFKLHKTFHRNKDARGVGLFLTKSQIETLGGSISMESEEGKGSAFTVNFTGITEANKNGS